MPDSVSRFMGFADVYDRARPQPPGDLLDLLCQLAAAPEPAVVDLGAGTGLSTVVWSGRAASVAAVEPSPDMRARLAERIGHLPDAAAFSVESGTAEATGLPTGTADVVTAGQALHWFDPARALREVARLLRPGGVFAAYDVDWPPLIDSEVSAAYLAVDQRAERLEAARGLRPRSGDKQGHLRRLSASGLFRSTAEVAMHARDQGSSGRLIDLALSQGRIVALLDAGLGEAELGLDQLRAVAAARLARPQTWWWTYRIRLAVL